VAFVGSGCLSGRGKAPQWLANGAAQLAAGACDRLTRIKSHAR
jgi:hypothetical protein